MERDAARWRRRKGINEKAHSSHVTKNLQRKWEGRATISRAAKMKV
jgi:predicted transposase YbfD/YdcC